MTSKVKVTYSSSDDSNAEDDSSNDVSQVTDNDGSLPSKDQTKNDIENVDSDVSDPKSDSDPGDRPSHQGLANVMAKILNKNIPKKKVILAKGKTDRELLELKRKTGAANNKEDFEVIGEKVSKLEEKEESSESENEHDPEYLRQKRLKKKLWEEMGRVKPQVLDKDKERSLQKIATRGVVQLFNAVKKQQKSMEEKLAEAGPSERRKDEVLKSMTKGQFLDVLKGTAPARITCDSKKSHDEISNSEIVEKDQKTVSYLRDDFMIGAKMKDWDKESESSEDNADGSEVEWDSDT